MNSLFDDISRSVASGGSRRHVLRMILAGAVAAGTFAPVAVGRGGGRSRVCCPTDRVCCAGVCCAPGEICDGNNRCAPVPPCDGGRVRCGTICCDPGQTCCERPLGPTCIQIMDLCGGRIGPEACCPQQQCCASDTSLMCCAPGEICDNGQCAQCPVDSPPCGGVDTSTPTVCCPTSMTCEAGQCLPICRGAEQRCGTECCLPNECCGGERPENQFCCSGACVPAGGGFVCEDRRVGLLSFPVEVHADGSVTLSWERAGEMNSAGFNLYRMRALGGSPVKINGTLIPAQGDAVFGASYSFVDKPGDGTFHYLLADVGDDGETTLHGPVEVKVNRLLH